MEGALESPHSLTTVLAILCIILCLHFAKGILELFWTKFEKKNEMTERLDKDFAKLEMRMVASSDKLETRLASIERDMNEVLQSRLELKKLLAVVQAIAGPAKWNKALKTAESSDIFRLRKSD